MFSSCPPSALICFPKKSSDSSLEAEDATPEQRTNHQLRRRVRHLEHGLRDMSARCQAERERRMALEALVGGKRF
jgi:hypothetical protein